MLIFSYMAINFNIGDVVTVQIGADSSINSRGADFRGANRQENLNNILTAIAYLNSNSLTVVNKGEVDTLLEGGIKVTRSFIQVAPQNAQNLVYNDGKGVILYWEKEEDDIFDSIFKVSDAYLEDTRLNKVLNITGKILNQGQIVKVTGYIKEIPALTVDADLGVNKNSIVFGILTTDIKDKDMGIVRWYRPKPFNPG